MIRALKAAFLGLLACTPPAWPQRPSDPDAAAMIETTRQKALEYTRSLPDFVCTEVVKRFSYISARQRADWRLSDKLTIKLSYFEQKEDHKLLLIDDKPTGKSFESLEGAIGVGEFGAMLYSIFNPALHTTFRWESWKNVRKHRVAVFAYTVAAAASHYLLVSGSPGHTHQAVVGYHGFLDIDTETSEVLNFTYQADAIPKELGLAFALTTVDYDFADVGGRDYLLPARSETEMHSPRLSVRNQMEFREYRKFSADSTITFDPGK
jgi:hypothetical protein